jgi:hypothetical protein
MGFSSSHIYQSGKRSFKAKICFQLLSLFGAWFAASLPACGPQASRPTPYNIPVGETLSRPKDEVGILGNSPIVLLRSDENPLTITQIEAGQKVAESRVPTSSELPLQTWRNRWQGKLQYSESSSTPQHSLLNCPSEKISVEYRNSDGFVTRVIQFY